MSQNRLIAGGLEGTGLHTGEFARLFVERLNCGKAGFEFESLPGINSFSDLKKTACSAKSGTVLAFQGGKLITPEHFFGVINVFSHLALQFRLKGRELPGGDGSGRPFFQSLERLFGAAGIRERAAFSQYSSKLETSYSCKNGWYRVKPADNFFVRYEIATGPVRQVCELDCEDPNHIGHFLERIVPSRTFITWRNYQSLTAGGLCKGASEDSGILLAESREEWRKALSCLAPSGAAYPFLNGEGMRWSGELAAHKILDLVGDLFLNRPGLPKLALEIKNGGHFQNHQLVKDLRNEHT
jgi:UDP-3-O-[3-hydroxymyristoyl] N-acetylglucosamine deacetylase